MITLIRQKDGLMMFNDAIEPGRWLKRRTRASDYKELLIIYGKHISHK
jgi:hypothetical protein